MSFRKILLPILAVLCCVACNNKKSFTIEGTLVGGAGKSIYIEDLTPDGPMFIDSVKLDKRGHFKFQYDEMSYRSFYNLHVSPIDYIVLLPDFGETIHVEGSYDSLSFDHNVSGSDESLLLWQLQQFTNDGIYVLRDLVAAQQLNEQALAEKAITREEYDAQKSNCDSIYLDTYRDQQQYITHFLTENRGSLTTLIALYKQFNNHPLLNEIQNFDYFEDVASALQENYPQNPHTLHFKNTVEHIRAAVQAEQIQ